ncbi:MAG: DegV family protein [Bacilli bacterium]|jgi:DegV family protein with EDD domain|nr:DegV family protein [Bacilli bacterium]
MSDYILSCCSTADLTKEHFEKRDIHYICFHYSLGGKEYPDDLGQSIPFPEFYDRMAKGEMTKTSQVSVGEFVTYFESFLKQGKDILHVTLSTGLSGVYNSAASAAQILLPQYPGRKIYIVDSLGASSGYGLLMDMLADQRDAGKNIDEVREFAENTKLHVHHWFFSTDLKYYVRGGRISKTAGFFGTLLHICPLLNMDEDGHLIPREKYITVKKVETAIVEKMVQNVDDGLKYKGKCYISQSNCLPFANAVKDQIEAKFPQLKGKVEIYSVGTTIGSHTGPGTVALFFTGKVRMN